MAFVVDLPDAVDRELTGVLALERSPLTKSEMVARLVAMALDVHPRIALVREALAVKVPA